MIVLAEIQLFKKMTTTRQIAQRLFVERISCRGSIVNRDSFEIMITCYEPTPSLNGFPYKAGIQSIKMFFSSKISYIAHKTYRMQDAHNHGAHYEYYICVWGR